MTGLASGTQLANSYLAQLDATIVSLAAGTDNIIYYKRYIDDGIAIIKLEFWNQLFIQFELLARIH